MKREYGLIAVLLLVWAILLIGWPGATLHTVDNIRDYRVALDIARGVEFPAASQPFAGRWQLPPLYFYLIALPLTFWSHELAVFLFTACLVWASIAGLTWTIKARFGTDTAFCYLLWAAPVHAVAVFNGVSNPALAFALVNLMLIGWFKVHDRPRSWLPIMLLAGLAAILMHPSAFAVALPLAVAALVSRPEHLRQASVWITLGLLAGLCLLWALRHGLASPEAQAAVQASIDWSRAMSRLVDPIHWSRLWTTPWTHLLSQQDLMAYLPRAVIVLHGLVFAALLISGLVLALTKPLPVVRPLTLVAFAAALIATFMLDSWGFWYLDVFWPPAALLAAVGGGLMLDAIRARAALRNALTCLIIALALLPAVTIKSILVKDERYRIALHGMFQPMHDTGAALDIPSAKALFRYRSFVQQQGGCDSQRFVGLEELWLRELTLRQHLFECPREISRSPGIQPSSPYLVQQRSSPADGTPWLSFASYALSQLPPQSIRIDGASERSQLNWQTGPRYSYYASLQLPASTTITADAKQTGLDMHLAFRCLNGEPKLKAVQPEGAMLQILERRELSPVRFLHARLPLPDHASTGQIEILESIACDWSAWMQPSLKP